MTLQDLLSHPLIHKYFSCSEFECAQNTAGKGDWHMAYRILQSMFEPLALGDRVLNVARGGSVIETIEPKGVEDYHIRLRLPDQFQEPEVSNEKCPYNECCKHNNQKSPAGEKCCETCKGACEGFPYLNWHCACHQKSDPVDGTIEVLKGFFIEASVTKKFSLIDFEEKLRELVKVARWSK